MNIRYRVTLTPEERQQLEVLVRGGHGSVRKTKRAQILLALDAKSSDEAIAQNVGVGTSTVYRTKQRFVEDGLERALNEAPRPGAPRKLGADDESLLIAVACSKPPAGCAKWTLDLLAGEMVRLTSHQTLSRDTVGRRLAELPLKPWQEKMWCIPAINTEYVARMEDVLDLYAEPSDPPWRHAKVTDQRTSIDFAECMRELVDQHYPEAERIRVVLDNLSTHSAAALYQAFEPAEARRILGRLEFHFTPKHASWFNMVEIEIGVMVAQCLDRRIPDKATLVREVAAWERRRNADKARINWMFTVDRAREKLARVYPQPATRSALPRAA